jgi:hypothetical protein
MSHQELTIAGILRALAAEYDGPVAERLILERVLQQRPSTAKNPFATIRERLRWDGLSLGWVRLSRRELLPLRVALHGLRFRCVPRPHDLAAGHLSLASLQPFAGLRNYQVALFDSEGNPVPMLDLAAEGLSEIGWHQPGFDLSAWYAQKRFAPGDSLLVTVLASEPLVLQFEHEPQANFRQDLVVEQDEELQAAMVAHVTRSQQTLIPCDDLVLPIFARAPWRTSYPGRPWQQLVASSGRLQMVDELFVSLRQQSPFRRVQTNDSPANDEFEQALMRHEEALWAEIDQLQHELRHSRQQDAEAGIWSGQIQRASAAFSLFERFRDEPHVPGLLDDLESLAAELELNGDDWSLDELEDDAEDERFGELPPLDPAEQPPGFQEAHDRMMAILPIEVHEQLSQARPEEVEVIIAAHLNTLLRRDPGLFPKIDLSPMAGAGEGGYRMLDHTDRLWQQEDDWDDDDDWGEDLSSELEERFEAASAIYTRSSDLMNQFYDYLRETGKSVSTARQRAQHLVAYAEFLASYYNRNLAEGDYATLDECLFYYYPRRVLNGSSRQVREMCVSLKQFYGFLLLRGDINDDRFAQAHWRRREQAARVFSLFERIANDTSDYEALFARLFAPYVP